MAGRNQNVGRRDRIARAVLTPVTVAATLWLYYSVPRNPLTLAVMGGLVFLALALGIGAVTGTCGIYAALGVDTCRCEDEYTGGSTWG
ncbi:DUF2892 domain-containing protein [Halorubrum sp. Boch-26]|uniref:YgaP family membrane protein n=1 Tax=Halorubrum sp. Boch-26 TaxID=2994426 RepID=UPI002469BAF3|nr:DUF2892 domain-containing protein [Halorubrum sp. Boch-26]